MILNFMKKFIKNNKNYKLFYILISLLFIIWMIFLDTHSLKTHLDLNNETENLKNQKKELLNSINKDKDKIKKLENIDSLEGFAREFYGHKKNNETIYIIEKE
tara:strand:- start:1115 stop:1423 length:309 start_codon:yes stop_codon:yes gene_type:complete